MVDLIPIGTANRSATENNTSKTPATVEETAPAKATADQSQPPRVERRRVIDRRRNRGDRRLLQKNSRGGRVKDRRQISDRRSGRRQATRSAGSAAGLTRKGRIIDEQV